MADDAQQAREDRVWWRSIGAEVGYHQLLGWTYRDGATFVEDGSSHTIDGKTAAAIARLTAERDEARAREERHLQTLNENGFASHAEAIAQIHVLRRRLADLDDARREAPSPPASIEEMAKPFMDWLWEECGGNHQPAEFYQRASDLLSAFAACVAAEQQWQPVDTMPIGRWVASYRAGEKQWGLSMRVEDDEWVLPDGRTTVTHHTVLPPTHWFDVPDPTALRQSASEGKGA
jgi:hypothetical protein